MTTPTEDHMMQDEDQTGRGIDYVATMFPLPHLEWTGGEILMREGRAEVIIILVGIDPHPLKGQIKGHHDIKGPDQGQGINKISHNILSLWAL